MKAGDVTAMVEYGKLTAKAEKLSKQLEKAKGEMTDAQMQRYLRILKKMAEAASIL